MALEAPLSAPAPISLRLRVAAALAAAVIVLVGLNLPLVEDGLFWWVPKGLWFAEHGPAWSAAGALPARVAQGLRGHDMVPQWQAGLPDWDHPPLWTLWLGLFLRASPTVQSAHLACLLPAVLAAVGWVALGERLGRPAAGLAPLCLPPVLAQLLRPDLDLPLLAVVPWALVALLDGAWWRAAALGLLAPWLKEPGVLLVVPAFLAARQARGGAPLPRAAAALAPLLGLGLWRLIHGPLAAPERLPPDLLQYGRDLLVVARVALWEQGRMALVPALAMTLVLVQHGRLAGRRLGLVAAFALTWLAFFAAVGFFATRDGNQSLTHVRYFLPGLSALAVLCSVGMPPMVLLGLFYVAEASPYGPEASLYGLQAALAEQAAAPAIQTWLDEGRTVWVGSYQAAGLLEPWAGITPTPPPAHTAAGGALRIYAEGTDPLAIQPGDIVLGAAYGEPTGALERALRWSVLDAWSRGDATVTAWRVEGRSVEPASSPGADPAAAPGQPGPR